MPICKVFLIRHGSTVLTAEDRFAGSTDVLLGTDGELQAAALGQRLQSKKLAAIYSSPMKRTIVAKLEITVENCRIHCEISRNGNRSD